MLDELALNPIAFNIGPIQVHWYGIFIASAVMLAVILSAHEAQRRHLDPENIYDLIIYALPIAIVSARIYYVIFQWGYYQNHLSQIVAIWDGGIAIYGGLIGAAITVYYFCKHRHISVWTMLDIVAPTVIMGQAIGRWGNFMNQEAFGQITSLAFLEHLHLPMWLIHQMFIMGAYRQPTFLYESVWDAFGFVLLMMLRHVPKLFKHGEVILCYVAWYAFGRFFTEGMRTDSLMLGNIRFSQLLSVIFLVSAIALIIVRRHRNPAMNWYLDE